MGHICFPWQLHGGSELLYTYGALNPPGLQMPCRIGVCVHVPMHVSYPLPPRHVQIKECLNRIAGMSVDEVLSHYGFVEERSARNLKTRATGADHVAAVGVTEVPGDPRNCKELTSMGACAWGSRAQPGAAGCEERQ